MAGAKAAQWSDRLRGHPSTDSASPLGSPTSPEAGGAPQGQAGTGKVQGEGLGWSAGRRRVRGGRGGPGAAEGASAEEVTRGGQAGTVGNTAMEDASTLSARASGEGVPAAAQVSGGASELAQGTGARASSQGRGRGGVDKAAPGVTGKEGEGKKSGGRVRKGSGGAAGDGALGGQAQRASSKGGKQGSGGQEPPTGLQKGAVAGPSTAGSAVAAGSVGRSDGTPRAQAGAGAGSSVQEVATAGESKRRRRPNKKYVDEEVGEGGLASLDDLTWADLEGAKLEVDSDWEALGMPGYDLYDGPGSSAAGPGPATAGSVKDAAKGGAASGGVGSAGRSQKRGTGSAPGGAAGGRGAKSGGGKSSGSGARARGGQGAAGAAGAGTGAGAEQRGGASHGKQGHAEGAPGAARQNRISQAVLGADWAAGGEDAEDLLSPLRHTRGVPQAEAGEGDRGAAEEQLTDGGAGTGAGPRGSRQTGEGHKKGSAALAPGRRPAARQQQGPAGALSPSGDTKSLVSRGRFCKVLCCVLSC